MNFKNYMEDVVLEVYKEFISKNPQYCGCERCSADTMVIALKKLKGLYAVSQEGEIFTKVSCEDRQIRADALIVIIEAATMVSQNPNH
ncbi:MAG TPA: late competence development ComFB family protein [Bacillota bacterium]|jgi:competence protein ComFB|nr:late competence development ComFB family protein [Bacillota bacterium]HOL10156.1 late competence development ComFB family protein [Bacillota bacterium]HPO97909.1 late competence development ComFB family protein [Bacillota bacterium]